MSKTDGHPRFRVGRSAAGLGLFALVPFRKGSRIIEYTGEAITPEEADRRRGRYLFEVDDRRTIDGKGRGNLARYINHACRPNCEPRIVRRRVYIYARRAIEPGEELTYHYGPVYFRRIIGPAGCRCATCERRRNAEAAKGEAQAVRASKSSNASTTASGRSRGRKCPATGTIARR